MINWQGIDKDKIPSHRLSETVARGKEQRSKKQGGPVTEYLEVTAKVQHVYERLEYEK